MPRIILLMVIHAVAVPLLAPRFAVLCPILRAPIPMTWASPTMTVRHFVTSLTGKRNPSACQMNKLSNISLLMVSDWVIIVSRMRTLVSQPLVLHLTGGQRAVLAKPSTTAYPEDADLKKVHNAVGNDCLLHGQYLLCLCKRHCLYMS